MAGFPSSKNQRPIPPVERHDHRQSLWVIAGVYYWCYRCGAIKAAGERGWTKPTGPQGANPADCENFRKLRLRGKQHATFEATLP